MEFVPAAVLLQLRKTISLDSSGYLIISHIQEIKTLKPETKTRSCKWRHPVDQSVMASFDPRAVHVRFIVNWVAQGAVSSSSSYFCFPCIISDSLRAGRSGDRMPVGGEIFRTSLDWPWGSASFLYDGYRIPFRVVKRPGRDVEHPPLSIAEVKERCTAIPLLFFWAFMACYRVNFILLFDQCSILLFYSSTYGAA